MACFVSGVCQVQLVGVLFEFIENARLTDISLEVMSGVVYTSRLSFFNRNTFYGQ